MNKPRRKIRRRESPDNLVVSVLVEKENDGYRAHCIEFDLAVSGKAQEQAMVRMERLILHHLSYAFKNRSNPVHFASAEIQQRWLDVVVPSESRKAWNVEIPLGRPKKVPPRARIRRHQRNFAQLSHV